MKAFLLLLLLVLIPLGASAADQTQTHGNTVSDFKAIVPIQGITDTTGGIPLTFGDYINKIFQISISLSAMLAVLMLIYGGFEYMTAEAVGGKAKGLDRIRSSLLGLMLLLSVFIILNVINPCILNITVLTQNTSDNCSPHTVAPQLTDEQVAMSQQGATYLTDGSCVTQAETTCVSGNQPVQKCQDTDNNFTDRPADGCGTLTDVYVCEQSACGAPPIAIPTGAHVYTGHDAQCMTNGCPGFTAPHCTNLHEACIFPGNQYSGKPTRGCPTTAQAGYICLDGVSEADLQASQAATVPSDATPLPTGSIVVARTASCPADHPNKENICQYGNSYTLGDSCTPASAEKIRCVRTCTDANDFSDCVPSH